MVLKEFRDSINEAINKAELPIDAIYYVMKDVMLDLESAYFQEIEREKYENLAKQQEAKEKNVNENSDEETNENSAE